MRVPDKISGLSIRVPCGRCAGCLVDKRREWHFRIMAELKTAWSAYFVTLTYDNAHLPVFIEDQYFRAGELFKNQSTLNKVLNEHPVLYKKDIQDFLKRLRWYSGDAQYMDCTYDLNKSGTKVSLKTKVSKIAPKGPNLRYFIVGEYGGRFGRPHYHALLFNVPIVKDISKFIEFCWQNGTNIHVGSLQDKSVLYTVSYLIMDLLGKQDIVKLQSLKPGIGYSYVKTHKDYHRLNKINYGRIGSTKVKLPAYFRNKIFSNFEKQIMSIETRKEVLRKEKEFEDECIKRGESPHLNRFEYIKQKTAEIREKAKNQKHKK